MSTAWQAMQPKKKRCERCGLYYTEKLSKCSHCSDLDERGLQLLLERHEESLKGNASLGKFFILGVIIIGAMLLLTI
jgi:hypothetical protein